MKQLHPTSLYAVELPEGATDVRISDNSNNPGILYAEKISGLIRYVPLKDNNYTFHFTTNTATEQDLTRVVPEMSVGNRWPNYCGDYPIWFHTRKESFHSLLAANGLPVEKNYAILGLKK